MFRTKKSRTGGWGQAIVCAALVFSVSAVSCRLGGPEGGGDQTGVTGSGGRVVLSRGPSVADGGINIAGDPASLLGGRPSLDGGAETSGGSGGTTGVVGTGGAANPAASGGNNGTGGPSSSGGSGVVPTASGCAPPFESNVCDPVCNTGCPALSRCNVTDAPQTGKCIGVWISGEGSLCLKTDITDPCAAHLTCVDGACRRLCYRDSDCASPGACCDQDLLLNGQASGFKICAACSR